MDYSKYSDFSPDQIIEKDYKKLCEHILSMAKDKQSKEKMERNTIRRWI